MRRKLPHLQEPGAPGRAGKLVVAAAASSVLLLKLLQHAGSRRCAACGAVCGAPEPAAVTDGPPCHPSHRERRRSSRAAPRSPASAACSSRRPPSSARRPPSTSLCRHVVKGLQCCCGGWRAGLWELLGCCRRQCLTPFSHPHCCCPLLPSTTAERVRRRVPRDPGLGGRDRQGCAVGGCACPACSARRLTLAARLLPADTHLPLPRALSSTPPHLMSLPSAPSSTPLPPTAELRVKYFDTIPTAASLCLLRKGFLFAAAEFGDHALYQFSVRGRSGGCCFCGAPL